MPNPLPDFLHECRRHKRLADAAIAALSDEAFFRAPGEQVNPVAVIVKHMAGNLRSRWSDFLATDGNKPDRRRDDEFVLTKADTRSALMAAWEAGWQTLTTTLESLSPDDLDRTVTIRGEPHTVFQAVLRGVVHAAWHVGQILYAARQLRPDTPWLTIAPGQSNAAQSNYLRSTPSSPND